MEYSAKTSFRFQTSDHAEIVKRCLEVDEELQPTKIEKVFQVDGPILTVLFRSSDPKVLRVAMSSFFDMMVVSVKSLIEFSE